MKFPILPVLIRPDFRVHTNGGEGTHVENERIIILGISFIIVYINNSP